jgi:hypothetical protein
METAAATELFTAETNIVVNAVTPINRWCFFTKEVVEIILCSKL